MFPPNQEVHYSWCPNIENARATLHNDINDSPQLLLIHTGTNDLSITTPIVEFIAELSTLITEAATKFPTSKIIYSTLLPRTGKPIPIITRINEQLLRNAPDYQMYTLSITPISSPKELTYYTTQNISKDDTLVYSLQT